MTVQLAMEFAGFLQNLTMAQIQALNVLVFGWNFYIGYFDFEFTSASYQLFLAQLILSYFL